MGARLACRLCCISMFGLAQSGHTVAPSQVEHACGTRASALLANLESPTMCSVAAAPFSPSAAGKAAKEAGSSSPENQFIRGTIGLHDKYMEYVQVRQAVQLLYTCSQSPQPPLVSPAHCTLVTKVPQKHSASTLYSNLVQRPQLPVVDSIPPSTLRLPSTLPAAALISALAFVP